MQDMVTHQAPTASSNSSTASATPTASPLVLVLWRRRWVVAFSVAVSLCAAVLYLMSATPVYRTTSRVVIAQNAPKPVGGGSSAPPSETFSETERDVFRSTSVLSRALQIVDYRKMRLFAGVGGDPVAFLQAGNGFDVETAPKSDVLVISMDSRYPQEAVEFIDGVVKAYIAEQADHDRSNGSEMLKVLRKEREDLEFKRQATLQAMAKSQQASGVMSFHVNENGNIVVQRVNSLDAALTSAQMATFELKGQQRSLRKALTSPESIKTYVENLQLKTRDGNDREYDELRTNLVQRRVILASLVSVQGPNHPTTQVERARVNALTAQVAQKEKEIVEALLASATDQLEATEERERELKEALAAQQKKAWDMGPEQARYAALEGDAAQIQKQIETLDERAAQLSADDIDATPLNVRVLDRAATEATPVSPQKGLTMLAGLSAGLILGIGAAMFRDWQDSRIRSPNEAMALMGAPILAVVPRVDAVMTPAARGQLVHFEPRSAAAEAYRSIRTSLSTGPAREAKTILIASASREDGKSMTAANLAITFAHAGHRTLLLDCDLRYPVQHMIFSREAESAAMDGEGLTSALAGEVRISSVIYATQVPGLCVLPCGPVPPNPSELLSGKRFEQLLDSLAASFDRVVIDSSSLASVSDARGLAALADVSLLVVRMNQSTRALCAMAMDSLLRVGANVAGVIANDVPMSRGQQEYYTIGGPAHYALRDTHSRRKLAAGSPRMSPSASPGVVSAIDELDWSTKTAVDPGLGDDPSGAMGPGLDASAKMVAGGKGIAP